MDTYNVYIPSFVNIYVFGKKKEDSHLGFSKGDLSGKETPSTL